MLGTDDTDTAHYLTSVQTNYDICTVQPRRLNGASLPFADWAQMAGKTLEIAFTWNVHPDATQNFINITSINLLED